MRGDRAAENEEARGECDAGEGESEAQQMQQGSHKERRRMLGKWPLPRL
jgi:hypothetical protein